MRHVHSGGKLPRRAPKINARDIKPGIVATGKSWEITAAPAEHVQPYLDSLAYRIDSDEGSIVFSGDTRPCQSLTDLAKGADLLVMECIKLHDDWKGTASADSETDTWGAGQTAQDAGVKRVLLNHQNLTLEDLIKKTQAIHEVKQFYGGPVLWADELMEVPFE